MVKEELGVSLLEELADLAAEAPRRKVGHIGPARVRAKRRQGLEALDRVRDGLDALGPEEEAGRVLADRLEGSALVERDDRGARGLRLAGGDPEILDAREEERSAPLEVVPHDMERLPAHEAHVRGSADPEIALLGARADDDEPPAEPRARVHGQVDPLVRDQGRDD